MFGFAKTKEEQAIADERCLKCKYLDLDLHQCTIRYSVSKDAGRSTCGSFKSGDPREMATIKYIENKNW